MREAVGGTRRTGRVTTPARLLEATRLVNVCNRERLGLGLGLGLGGRLGLYRR